jgi:uncharacterized protein (TIGR03437 family)
MNRFTIAFVAVVFPMAAFADISGTATISAGGSFSLDNGANVSSGGDISYSGTSLTFVGSAKGGSLAALGISGAAAYAGITQLELTALASLATNAPIPLSSLSVNAILGVATNGGNASKLLVTAISTSSISFQYTTYETAAPTGPTITKVTNNYSYTPNGFSNSGISPSTIFTIFGSNLSDPAPANLTLNRTDGAGIPTKSGGATVSVTVGGKTVTPGLYYAIPTQIAAVLPAGTPTGAGTVTVTYNGANSAAFSINVVPATLGLDTYYGTGSGLITATSATLVGTIPAGTLFNYTNSAAPGQTIVLWGSGLGADTQDSDTVFTSTPHAVNQGSVQVYFGNVAGAVGYAGSSGYPGLNQINVTIPTNAPTGCGVSVAVVVLGVTSNFGTLPIGQGVCSDPVYGTNGTLLGQLSGQTTVKSGSVIVGQSVDTSGTSNIALASFSSNTGSSYGSTSGIVSLGSCLVTEVVGSSGSSTSTGLDAGASIALTGPLGAYTLNPIPIITGTYTAQLPGGAITSTGGAFTFKGPGGANVGAFTTTVNLPNPLMSWTNQSAGATVTRSQGVQINWSGGTPGSYVVITGSSSGSGGTSGSFVCYAPQSALTFTVPPYVTGTLPAGSGSLSVENGTNFVSFSASGLDNGIGFGFNSIGINSTYQ